MARILRVNLENGKIVAEEMPPEWQALGGRALTSSIIHREVPPKADPLGVENKLVFSGGIFAGTAVPCNGRLSVGAKSPLTGTIKEANAGGAVAQKLARLGFRAVVIEGRARELTSLKIGNKGAALLPSPSLKGLDNLELVELMRKEHGEKIACISIGSAGERMLMASSVMTTTPDFHVRAAGRGGLGAVMGSKNLKVVIVDDSGADKMKVRDEAGLKEAAAAISKAVLSNPFVGALRELGTANLVMAMNSFGCLPTKNYSAGCFEEAAKISGERMTDLMKQRPRGQHVHRCMNSCIVNCSNIYTDENGEMIVSGLEYETLGLVGSNCMIDDLDAIAHINRVCNDVGVDTMDVGAAIAVAMEAGLLPWGGGKEALALVAEIGQGTGKGLMIGNGCRFTGEKLGVRRIPHVKGQGLSAYDPRAMKGTGVTYATSPMGADHTAGAVFPDPGNPSYDPGSSEGQCEPSQFMQTYVAAIDALGLCIMVGLPLLGALGTPAAQAQIASCVSAVADGTFDENYLSRLGNFVLNTERAFNDAAGFTKDDDRLPDFFRKEALPPGGKFFDVPEEEIDRVNRGLPAL
jgi:aldehyde:ferredoxin oxidoreductase